MTPEEYIAQAEGQLEALGRRAAPSTQLLLVARAGVSALIALAMAAVRIANR